MVPEAARRQALLEFGATEPHKEELRDVYRLCSWTHYKQSEVHRPVPPQVSLATAVILTLALGIGGNSAVFSTIDAILLKPLPFPESDRLMTLRQSNSRLKIAKTYVAAVRIEDSNRMKTTFQAITGYYAGVPDTSGALPERNPGLGRAALSAGLGYCASARAGLQFRGINGRRTGGTNQSWAKAANLMRR